LGKGIVHLSWTGDQQYGGTDSGKKCLDLRGLQVDVSSKQDPDPPRTFREIKLIYHPQGVGLTQKAIDQAIELSLTKYYSVAATISGKAEITFSSQIEQAAG
jgi:putative redox protein